MSSILVPYWPQNLSSQDKKICHQSISYGLFRLLFQLEKSKQYVLWFTKMPFLRLCHILDFNVDATTRFY